MRGVGSKCPKPSGRARAVWGKKPKRSRGGSALANITRRGFLSGRGDPIGAGYAGVEVVGGCDWARCKGVLVVAKKAKPSCGGSVLANETRGGFFSGRGDPIGAGYAVVEVVVGCDWVRREGGLVVAKKAKPSCGASVLANEMWGAFLSGRGDPIGAGYAVVEVVVGCDWVRREGGLVVAIKAKPSRGGSALANETRRDLFSGRGDPIGAA